MAWNPLREEHPDTTSKPNAEQATSTNIENPRPCVFVGQTPPKNNDGGWVEGAGEGKVLAHMDSLDFTTFHHFTRKQYTPKQFQRIRSSVVSFHHTAPDNQTVTLP